LPGRSSKFRRSKTEYKQNFAAAWSFAPRGGVFCTATFPHSHCYILNVSIQRVKFGGAYMTATQKREIMMYRSRGVSYASIAEHLHLSINTVKTFCRRNALDTTDIPRRKNVSSAKQCVQCGETLSGGRSTRVFCSDLCRLKWHRKNKKPNAVCGQCGRTYHNNGHKNQKYSCTAYYAAARFGNGGDAL
jgi:predicted nucleic acid-binding Zn ribbon protein